MQKTKILFVCHGNICRSPMAEVIFRDLAAEAGVAERFTVASCATSTEEIWNGIGNPVYPPAKAELARHGHRCPDRRAVLLTKADYDRWDIFLIMDERNRRGTDRIFGGDPAGKVHKLLPRDVEDPWYSGNFSRVYRDLREGCEAWLEKLTEPEKK